MHTLAFRLHRGDDLLPALQQEMVRRKIRAAAVVSGVGCVTQATLRDATGVRTHTLSGRREIVSLTGTLSAERCHLHISLADEQMQVLGGHLCPGTLINTTCEVVVLILENTVFSKAFDASTGYNELVITDNTPSDE